jgi:tol-pal system protein YbgF
MKSFIRHHGINSLQAALAACCLFIPVAAHAQQDDTFNRLNRLEREIDTLNRAVYRGDAPPPSSGGSTGDAGYQSNLEVRLADLEKQLRDLTGKLEQQTFEIQQLRERLDRSQSDMELRIGELEKKNGISQPGMSGTENSGMTGNLAPDETATPPMPSAQTVQPQAGNAAAPITDPNAPAPADSPTQRQLGTLTESPGGASIPPAQGSDPASSYEHAFSQLKSGNYNGAQRSFDGFLNQYPNHPLASNATYWLGETYYAQGKYDQASRIFAESYKKYPQGPKAADSLLKLGMSLGGSGKTKEACVSLKQLKKAFSTGQSAALRRADQEMTRLGCS